MRTRPLIGALLAVFALSAPALPAAAAPVHFSNAELGAAKSTLDRRLHAPPDGVTSWGVDPSSGRVTISVLAGDSKAMAAAKSSIAGLSAAKIITVTQRPRPLYNLIGGQKISTSGGSCSIGFSARDSSGNAYVLTAGHCTVELSGTWSGYNGVAIGPAVGKNFPTDDFGSIKVNSTSVWTPTTQVQGTTARVAGSTEAAVGASVCRSGITTGWHCGTIQAKNQTVNYGGGKVVYGLTKTNACAEPGDSGGSWMSGTQAQGVTSGGSGNCTSGGTTYFQPVNEILSKYGLTLVTGSTPPPVVTLCSDVNYGGNCQTSSSDSADLRGSFVGNDTLSSVRVPSGAYLSLYYDINYTGACQSFSADTSSLIGTRIGNDAVSSFKITTSAPSGCPST